MNTVSMRVPRVRSEVLQEAARGTRARTRRLHEQAQVDTPAAPECRAMTRHSLQVDGIEITPLDERSVSKTAKLADFGAAHVPTRPSLKK
jgi:hypothetical protein